MQRFFVILLVVLLTNLLPARQAVGEMAFVGFNADGDDDFAVVLLSDVTNKEIFFSDRPLDGAGGFAEPEGTLQWDTGLTTISAGTVITFTDADNDPGPFAVSVGTLTMPDTGFNLSGTADSIVAFEGTDENTPVTFLAGIQNSTATTPAPAGPSGAVGDLTGSGLVAGTNFVNFSAGPSDDGGEYTGARSGESAFLDYKALVNNPTNWGTAIDGETLLPLNATAFTVVPEPSAFLFGSLICGVFSAGSLGRKWFTKRSKA